MDPLIKSQLLYQLSYAPTGRDGQGGVIATRSRFVEGFAAPQSSVFSPVRGMRTSRWIETDIIRPIAVSTVSIAVPP